MTRVAGVTVNPSADPCTRAVSSFSAIASSTGVRVSVAVPSSSPAGMVSIAPVAVKSAADAAAVAPSSGGTDAPATVSATRMSTELEASPVNRADTTRSVGSAPSSTCSGVTVRVTPVGWASSSEMVTSAGVTSRPADVPVTCTVSLPSATVSSAGVSVSATVPSNRPAGMVSVAAVAV